LQYGIRPLIGAFMYLTLGVSLEQFTAQYAAANFPSSSHFLLDHPDGLNGLFSRFAESCLGLQLTELLPALQFAASFITLEVNNDLPSAVKQRQTETLSGHFEDFLAFQTHHPSALNFIIHRRSQA
jgi:hypothetical protein